jgi:hypothetical protein
MEDVESWNEVKLFIKSNVFVGQLIAFLMHKVACFCCYMFLLSIIHVLFEISTLPYRLEKNNSNIWVRTQNRNGMKILTRLINGPDP